MKDEFIDGIYNYCDRWCERCGFTSHCRSYEGTSNLSPEQLDVNNKAFWQNIAASFETAGNLLLQLAEREGIDLAKVLSEDDTEYVEKRAKKQLPWCGSCNTQ